MYDPDIREPTSTLFQYVRRIVRVVIRTPATRAITMDEQAMCQIHIGTAARLETGLALARAH